MHFTLPLLSLIGSAAAVLECTPKAFSSILSPGAYVVAATSLKNNGTFKVPGPNINFPVAPTDMPPLCALQVQIPTSNSSFFQFGLYLPDAAHWNKRMLTVGNYGLGGGINWLAMGSGTGYGFAAMSTDTGHNSSLLDGTWALGHPQQMIDWGYRSMHMSVVQSKQIIKAYYETNHTYSYYSGCSNGGRQGLKNMQLYPADFDGVLAGCAPWWTTHFESWIVKVGLDNAPGPGQITYPQFSLIEAEVQRQCDTQDGVKDGIVSDPKACNFYMNALLCPTNSTPSATKPTCLSWPQLQTLKKIWTDYIDTNATYVHPTLNMGSEAQWPLLLGGSTPSSLGVDYMRDWLYNNSNWNYTTEYDYSTVQLADGIDPGSSTADKFDLSAFRARGGKLITYHGTADGIVPTGSGPLYHDNVYATMSPHTSSQIGDFFRFFLVPGMQHCANTAPIQQAPWYFAGANQAGVLGTGVWSTPGYKNAQHDILLALIEWTEKGIAPNSVIATLFNEDNPAKGVKKQRPLCVYPQKAMYRGGNVNLATSWVCGTN